MDYLVVGAGFSGAVCARQLADAGRWVRVVDRRTHIAGNAHDRYDDHGVLVHSYGPHIFHTNSAAVFDFLSRFTAWRPYEHRVLATVDGRHFPIPINRTTINAMYGMQLDEEGVRAFLERVREPRDPIRTSEDAVLASVGRDLCDKFFRGYTRKQWDLDLSELSASVAARIPTRHNDDDRYFTDRYQAMPRDGYTKLFERMLDHPNIELKLATDFKNERASSGSAPVIYTGPIDEYFGFCYGRLPYRSLRFEFAHHAAVRQYQPVAQVNFPNDHDYTRITEFKQLTGQDHPGTTIAREYPCWGGEPCYPVPNPANEALYRRYDALAQADTGVHFVGRLAQYRYLNMDQAVGGALALARKILLGDGPSVAAPQAQVVASAT